MKTEQVGGIVTERLTGLPRYLQRAEIHFVGGLEPVSVVTFAGHLRFCDLS